MKTYWDIQAHSAKIGTIVAIASTVIFHVGLVIVCVTSGLTYLDPPPPEQSILIDFSETDIQEHLRTRTVYGLAPRAVEPDKTKPVNLVQRSEAQEIGKKANEAMEATGDDFGDVEKYEPPREKPIDSRSLFHAADNKSDKDTLAPQTADKISKVLKPGHPQGNSSNSKVKGIPNAHLKGLTVTNANIPMPAYNTQESGIVVMNIVVNQYGCVTRANIDIAKTTITSPELRASARSAAMATHFNVIEDGSAPAMQTGTITYYFNLTER